MWGNCVNGGSTVVEHSPHDPMVQGSSPVASINIVMFCMNCQNSTTNSNDPNLD
jgi:hypothetical protein